MPNSLAKLAQLSQVSRLLRQGHIQKESSMMGAVGTGLLNVGKAGLSMGKGVAKNTFENPVRNTMAAVGTGMLPGQVKAQNVKNLSGFDPARHNQTLGITPGAGALQGGGGVSQ